MHVYAPMYVYRLAYMLFVYSQWKDNSSFSSDSLILVLVVWIRVFRVSLPESAATRISENFSILQYTLFFMYGRSV